MVAGSCHRLSLRLLRGMALLHQAPQCRADALTQSATLLTGGAPDNTHSVLEEMVRSRVVPELVALHATQGATTVRAPDQRAMRFAELLLCGQMTQVEIVISDAVVSECSVAGVYRVLIEPAARHLGDLWIDDLCDECEVTCALCHLQAALRAFAFSRLWIGPRPASRLALVVRQPGERHSLGLLISEDILKRAGWTVQMGYPATDAELATLVASAPYDALHLWLSSAFPRADALARMSKTVRIARSASCREELSISVGGRLFADGRYGPAAVGADYLTR